jgi:2-methylisocitrate lyase-like PEP mutase family enzyme
LFLPGISQPRQIDAVVREVALPLNVMAWPGFPDADQLGNLEVRRLSAGSAISQVLWAKARELADLFVKSGHFGTLSSDAMPYPQVQEVLA